MGPWKCQPAALSPSCMLSSLDARFLAMSSKTDCPTKNASSPSGTAQRDSVSRATEVTVHAGGVSKTTHFWYGLEPHETKVWGGGNPEIVYSIGEDGSVFKWAYAEVPPTIRWVKPTGVMVCFAVLLPELQLNVVEVPSLLLGE